MKSLVSLLSGSPLLPIIQTDQPTIAVALAKAMHQGGVTAVEVVLRTPTALESISRIREALPELQVGAGTILSAADAVNAKNAGAQFLVSPASTSSLLSAMIATDLPLAPGVSTASEIAMALEMGLTELKFFPAHLSGGTAMLNALSSIFRQVKFCPTGGIGLHNLQEFLQLPNVFVAGGSWLTPADLVRAGDYQAITRLVEQSLALAAVEPLRKQA